MLIAGLQDANQILERAAETVFAVRATPSIAEWSDQHRNLVKGERQGKWNTDDVPYARGIFAALQDAQVRQVTLMKAAQLGGSEIMYCWLCWAIEQDPTDTLLVMPNEEKAAHLKNNRLIPTFQKCDAVMRQVMPGKEKFEGLLLQFARMNLRLIGSKSKADIEGDPFGRVLVDETDRCEEYTVDLVKERTKTYTRVKIAVLGTPEHEGMGVHRAFLQGTQERFHVPCPHGNCGAYFARDWRGVKWKGGAEADPDEVMQTAWYRCPHCRQAIDASHNRWQMSRGVWAPKGCGVKHDGTLVVPEGLKLPVGHRSFHLHGLDNALVPNPYGVVARGFLDQGAARTMGWTNDTCGEPWKQAGDRLELKTLQEFCAKSTYLRGHVPADVLALACGVDVQHDRLFAAIWGFGPQGKTAYKIAWAEIPLDHGHSDPLIGLSRWIDGRTWCKNECKLRVIAEFVDSGDQAEMVYRSCRGRGFIMTRGGPKPRRVPVKGNSNILAPHKFSLLENSKAGGDGLMLLHVNAMHWTSWMLSQLGVKQSDDGMEGEEAGEGDDGKNESSSIQPHIFFPRDTDDATLLHYTNETLVREKVGGKIKLLWKLRDDHAPNHYCDAGRYALAGADVRGARNLGAGKKPATKPANAQSAAMSTTTQVANADRGGASVAVDGSGRAESRSASGESPGLRLPESARESGRGSLNHNPLAYAQRR